tara:strand:- start:1548 stop:1715 length:168 start_codon:yes stop_codon:yes gene_type:complete
MSKKSKTDQWGHYKKWTTSEGYTFLAKSKEDALDYIKTMPDHMGDSKTLKEVTDV